MDEEDGRTGPLAASIGHSDATKDALPKSLRLAAPRVPHPDRVPHPSFAWVGDHDPVTTFLKTTFSAHFGEEGRGCSPGMAQPPARLVTGHDFSRAATVPSHDPGFSPCATLTSISASPLLPLCIPLHPIDFAIIRTHKENYA